MIKIIFENSNPCPLDSSIMCKNAEITKDDNHISIICKEKCKEFMFYKCKNDIHVIRR